jgi:hypothetical protein
MFGNAFGSSSVVLVLASLFAWVVPVLVGGTLVYYAVRRGVRDGLRDAATLDRAPEPPILPVAPPGASAPVAEA